MNTKLLNYVCDYVPKYLRVEYPDSKGHIAKLIIDEEAAGNELFSADNFRDMRKRAELAIPYQVNNGSLYKRDHVLNVLECAGLNHRQVKHGEDHRERMQQIIVNGNYSETEMDIMTADFWN